jgi:hypothetical protein
MNSCLDDDRAFIESLMKPEVSPGQSSWIALPRSASTTNRVSLNMSKSPEFGAGIRLQGS